MLHPNMTEFHSYDPYSISYYIEQTFFNGHDIIFKPNTVPPRQYAISDLDAFKRKLLEMKLLT